MKRFVTASLPVLSIVFSIVLACVTIDVRATDASDDAAARGRLLYRGVAPFAAPARVNGVALPASDCARCHGLRGEGRTEAGVVAPPLRGDSLRVARDGRPAFAGMQDVLAAITSGLGRDGRPLDAAMPRYALDDAERRAIAAWLERLQSGRGAVRAPGVTDREIRVGMLVPVAGPAAAAAASARAGLDARLDAINATGGVFGRRIVVERIAAGADTGEVKRAISAVNAHTPLFALVANVHAGDAGAVAAHAATLGVPTVASIGMAHRPGTSADATFLLPSIEAQAVDAAAALAQDCPGAPRDVAIVHDPRLGLAVAAADAVGRLAQRGVTARVATIDEARAQTVAPAEAVLLLAGGAMASKVASKVASEVASEVASQTTSMTSTQRVSAGAAHCTGVLAVLSGATTGADLVATPWRAATSAGRDLWHDLGMAAGSILVEALARAGRALDADALGAAIDSLQGFEAVPGLSVTFAPTRRHAIGEAALAWSPRR